MIQINLLPGAGNRTRGRSARIDLSGVASGVLSKVKDPYLIGAVESVMIAGAAIGVMFWHQRAQGVAIDERLQRAEQDSIRFAAVIREKHKAEAQRDSVVRQVELIRAFDNKRFVWPHLMDEVSRALPPYTWLTSVAQTNAQTTSAQPATPPASGDKGGKDKPSGPPAVDSLSVPKVQFRIIGNTVDLQALARFMKLLEASPFVENVQLAKSSIILVDGKEVTEFQLDASYQTPDSSTIKLLPVSLSVR